ncbi:DUF885 domain-containing protein [Leucobacter sp. UT-8R-CII-1-4]|uniref:DUF885 domain-containing protein n=1 Tax=Leucobacter sp. UT-8R-CII-1-4 TaxID=3040075 RepID=UPI0024A90392|nr:DUF885 domain-containing protein [Leucobacter sp. UT-8R-CII-1-4]MDI6023881.1 DUF885 domain-containing protein [Leucobacter sp. UT-8R-CII-1-4]
MTSRQQTDIDQIAESWVDTLVQHDPTTGTYIGRSEVDAKLPDYSPEGAEAFADAQRATLQALENATPADDVDRVTRADLAAELRLSLARHEAGESLRNLNVIESPAQGMRDIFDLMPHDNAEQWQTIEQRMRAVPAALAGYRESLVAGMGKGLVPAIRQVREVAAQSRRVAGTAGSNDGFFTGLATSAGASAEAQAAQLDAAASAASAAYLEFAEFLENDLAPKASETDAFGRERYELASEAFLGMRVDLDETYEWGLEELARMVDEQERIAAEITGSTRHPGIVAEAIAQLEADPARKLYGTDALKQWMQETSDRAVAELAGTQFDIPDEIRALECMIAPTQEGGIYYTGPSDDFSRPGRMWWSVPEGVTEFDTWRELTTVYHEGVPGHHLQIGSAVVNRDSLNEWRRQLAGTSGHAEGWALYAERLMEQLGYLDDPADKLGMLDGQRMRAARVVLDIGVHLGKVRPDGAAIWDGEYALDFMRQNVNMNEGFVRFEVNRYLGWGGQAPSYKIGQRIWEQLRDEVAARAASGGSSFDIRDFHRQALSLGGMRLDTLQQALRGELRD